MTDRLDAVERAVIDLLRSSPEAALDNLLRMTPDAREAVVIGLREMQMKLEAMKNYIDATVQHKMPPPGPMPDDFRFEDTPGHQWLKDLESMPEWPEDEIGDNVIRPDDVP